MAEIFLQISLILAIAALIGGVLRWLGQPLIIAYIFTGILVSPYFFDLNIPANILTVFSHIGVAFLLFLVGISLNPKLIHQVGKISVITGLGQVIFTSLFGFGIALLLGFSALTSLYIAVALTFSSTIIIMKLLSDKGDLDTLYGRIAVGFLLVQDIIVILVFIILTSISSGDVGSSLSYAIVKSLVLMAGLVTLVLGAAHYFLPKIMKFIARSQEYLLLFSVAWCFLLSAFFSYLNFSLEIGALVAGISLSTTSYRHEIAARMKPLRDFFLMLFFVLLGSQMVFSDITAYLSPIVIFSLFILIGNPLIVLLLMGIMGYTKKTGFNAGLTVAQISEFSLILISMGVSAGHLSSEILSMVTVIGLITITGSTYLITYSAPIYQRIHAYLNIFERKQKGIGRLKEAPKQDYEIILFGYGRIGYDVLSALNAMKRPFLIVDYNPDRISQLSQEGYACRYGDAEDAAFLEELGLDKAKMIVSTIHDVDANLLLLEKINEKKKEFPIFIAISDKIDDALALYDKGAEYVLLPYSVGGHHVSSLIEQHMENPQKFLEERFKHLEYLKKRKKP